MVDSFDRDTKVTHEFDCPKVRYLLMDIHTAITKLHELIARTCTPAQLGMSTQAQVVDGRIQILPNERKSMIEVEIPSAEPAPPEPPRVISFCGEDYYFAGEESRYCNGGPLYWIGTYKTKKGG